MLKRSICLLLSLCMILPINTIQISATEGKPYIDEVYDVKEAHLIINQFYAGGYSNYSFIELYNPTNEDVDLSHYSLQYISSPEGGMTTFSKLDLTGMIPSNCSYLIRCNKTSKITGGIQIENYDQAWDQVIYPKGGTVVLVSNSNLLQTTEIFNGTPLVDGYVDMLAVSGNDGLEAQKAACYEDNVSAVQSKKKGIRRNQFMDTDHNDLDTMMADYSFENQAYIDYIHPHCVSDGPWQSSSMPSFTVTFDNDGKYTMESYPYYSSIVEPAIPSKEGYNFDGWYLNDLAYDFSTLPIGDITLVAKWQPIEIKRNKEEIDTLLTKVPQYLNYYTTESVNVIKSINNKINNTDFNTATQETINTLYDDLNNALENLVYKTNDVPQVYITTNNGDGLSLQKATGYVYTDLAIVDTTGKTIEENDTAQIKVRGNSTAAGAKKPYNIKFSSKQDVLGMGKAKKWALLANCYDVTLMRNYIAFDIADHLGLDYTSQKRYCDVYLDGKFLGNYLLCENVEAGTSRVDIDLANGEFLLEYNTLTEEGVTYLSYDHGVRFAMCDPDEPTEEQRIKADQTMRHILDVLDSGNYEQVKEVVDVDSFSKVWLVASYMKTLDFTYSSVYFYYKDGKLYAGPIWDNDMSSGNRNDYKNENINIDVNYVRTYANLYKYLFEYKDFALLCNQDYQQEKNYFKWVANDYIDEIYHTYKGTIDRNYNEAGWRVDQQYFDLETPRKPTYIENLNYLKNWLSNRCNVLDCFYNDLLAKQTQIVGSIDAVNVSNNKVKITGYAYDVCFNIDTFKVKIYKDDTYITTVDANEYNANFFKFQGGLGKHYFSYEMDNNDNAYHVIKAFAITREGKEVLLGNPVTIGQNTSSYDPVGCIDLVQSVSTGVINVAGWAFDKDGLSTSVVINVYVKDYFIGSLVANQTREDVNKAYGITGKHGFSGYLYSPFDGNVEITLKMKDINTNKEFTIGTRTIQMVSNGYTTYTTPDGGISAIDASTSGQITVSGYAFDYDDCHASLRINVYVGNTLVGSTLANKPSSSYNLSYGLIGNHAFNDNFKTNITGLQEIKVKGYDLGTQKEVLIASKYVTIGQIKTNNIPTYSLDVMNLTGNRLLLQGWTFDKDDVSQSLTVNVYEDSALVGSFKAKGDRPDVNKAYGIIGNHGMNDTVILPYSGTHTITVKVVDLVTNKEYTMGTKKVTIEGGVVSPIEPEIVYPTNYDPQGVIDTVSSQEEGIVRVTGWVFDKDSVSTSLDVKVYIGTTCIATLKANQTRDDVNKVYGITGKHGFGENINTTFTGNQTIIVKAVDLKTNKEVTIGSRSVTIKAAPAIPVEPEITTNYAPQGVIDTVSSQETGIVRVTGWAFDKDSVSTSLDIKVYIGSTCIGTLKADQTRDDVNKAYKITGKHGFSGNLSTTFTGNQTIIVKAVDLKTNKEVTIASKNITIKSSTMPSDSYPTRYQPIGCVDLISISDDGKINIAGWAFDKDSVNTSLDVKVYIGSTCIGTLKADHTRDDVNKAYGITGKHGYSGNLYTTFTGNQMVVIKVVDLETRNEVIIGSKNVTINSSNPDSSLYPTKYLPQGVIDTVSSQEGGIVRVTGWAFDKDSVNTSLDVKVYIGSTCIGTLKADQTRDDVNKAYGITGKHGFGGNLNTTFTGNQTIIVKAVDLQSGKEVTLGFKNIIVKPLYTTDPSTSQYSIKYNPTGCVDLISTSSAGKIYVAGWAFDKDSVNTSLDVKVYIGSTCIGTLKADQTRDDVNKAFNITGKHGYSSYISTSLSGSKTVVVKAIDLQTYQEYTIGSKTINIQ